MKKKAIVPTALLTAVLAAARYVILPLSPGKSSMRSFLVATALPLLCSAPHSPRWVCSRLRSAPPLRSDRFLVRQSARTACRRRAYHPKPVRCPTA